MKLDIKACARCEEDHDGLVFQPLTRTMQVTPAVDWQHPIVLTHWASCPTNGEPILMRITTLPEPE